MVLVKITGLYSLIMKINVLHAPQAPPSFKIFFPSNVDFLSFFIIIRYSYIKTNYSQKLFHHSHHCYSSNMPPTWLKRYKPLEDIFYFFHCKCIPHIQPHLSQSSWLRLCVLTETLFFTLSFLASHGILHQYPFFELFFSPFICLHVTKEWAS